jgi:hypothetical protein
MVRDLPADRNRRPRAARREGHERQRRAESVRAGAVRLVATLPFLAGLAAFMWICHAFIVLLGLGRWRNIRLRSHILGSAIAGAISFALLEIFLHLLAPLVMTPFVSLTTVLAGFALGTVFATVPVFEVFRRASAVAPE